MAITIQEVHIGNYRSVAWFYYHKDAPTFDRRMDEMSSKAETFFFNIYIFQNIFLNIF